MVSTGVAADVVNAMFSPAALPSHISRLLQDAKSRHFSKGELADLLDAASKGLLPITNAPVSSAPSGGTILIFDRRTVKRFRKDHIEWRGRKNKCGIAEGHERFVVPGEPVINLDVYYATSADGTIQRRIAWRIFNAMGANGENVQTKDDLILVHYLAAADIQQGAACVASAAGSTRGALNGSGSMSMLPLVSTMPNPARPALVATVVAVAEPSDASESPRSSSHQNGGPLAKRQSGSSLPAWQQQAMEEHATKRTKLQHHQQQQHEQEQAQHRQQQQQQQREQALHRQQQQQQREQAQHWQHLLQQQEEQAQQQLQQQQLQQLQQQQLQQQLQQHQQEQLQQQQVQQLNGGETQNTVASLQPVRGMGNSLTDGSPGPLGPLPMGLQGLLASSLLSNGSNQLQQQLLQSLGLNSLQGLQHLQTLQALQGLQDLQNQQLLLQNLQNLQHLQGVNGLSGLLQAQGNGQLLNGPLAAAAASTQVKVKAEEGGDQDTGGASDALDMLATAAGDQGEQAYAGAHLSNNTADMAASRTMQQAQQLQTQQLQAQQLQAQQLQAQQLQAQAQVQQLQVQQHAQQQAQQQVQQQFTLPQLIQLPSSPAGSFVFQLGPMSTTPLDMRSVGPGTPSFLLPYLQPTPVYGSAPEGSVSALASSLQPAGAMPLAVAAPSGQGQCVQVTNHQQNLMALNGTLPNLGQAQLGNLAGGVLGGLGTLHVPSTQGPQVYMSDGMGGLVSVSLPLQQPIQFM